MTFEWDEWRHEVSIEVVDRFPWGAVLKLPWCEGGGCSVPDSEAKGFSMAAANRALHQ